MQDIRLSKRGVYLGRVGETGRYRVWLDVSSWEEEYSGGTGLFLLTNPEGTVIPMSTSVETDEDEVTKLYGEVTDTETAIAGVCVIEATWTSGGVVAKSDHFNGLVLEATYTGETTPDSTPTWVRELMTELTAAGVLLEQAAEVQETVEDILENINSAEENAEQSAEDAEAWAVGKRNGEDVDEEDPTYGNNAKKYAQDAGGSAAAAGVFKQEAEAWAKGTKNGTEVGSTDPAYQNNAKYYAEQAFSGTPEGYADLVGDVGDLKSALEDVANGSKSLDITDYPAINCTISASGTANRDGTQFVSQQIPTDDIYGAVTFAANTGRVGVISFLKTAIPSDVSSNADLSGYFATGETGRHMIAAGETESFILPDDTKYLFISRVSSGIETLPENVTVYTKIVGELEQVKADVQNVYAELAPTYNATSGSYQMGDAVNNSGGLYVAKESASGEWDGTKWLSVSATEIARYSLWAVEPSIDVYDVINASTAKWYASGNYRGTITLINGAKRLCIKAGVADCLYSLLKSGIVKSGETPDYADGYSGAVRITAGTETVVDAPDDARYLYMLSKGSMGNNALPARVLAYGEKPKQILSGLNVSVIGDSISAFTGMIPSGNLAYYTRSNAGVRVPTEMWWYHFSEITGGKLLINDSWSGSPVTDVRASTHTAMADVSRCQNLHSWEFGTSEDYDLVVTSENIGTLRQSPFRTYERAFQVGDYLKKVSPDVILIAGGGNDYNREAGLGTWDGHTTLDTTNIHTFREAYANMINRMHEAYPYALIVCLKPWYWRQPVTAKEQAITNDDDRTYKDYWDAICQIADLMSCPVIDGITIGFNPWNYYPTFCEDNANMPVHPNALGQKIMGETVADAMKNVCVGYVGWMKARS